MVLLLFARMEEVSWHQPKTWKEELCKRTPSTNPNTQQIMHGDVPLPLTLLQFPGGLLWHVLGLETFLNSYNLHLWHFPCWTCSETTTCCGSSPGPLTNSFLEGKWKTQAGFQVCVKPGWQNLTFNASDARVFEVDSRYWKFSSASRRRNEGLTLGPSV